MRKKKTDPNQAHFFEPDYRKKERERYEQAESQALYEAPLEYPLMLSRKAILRSFLGIWLGRYQIDPDALMKEKLKIFEGRTLEDHLELDHDWQMIRSWMKEVRIQRGQDGWTYLIESV